MKASLVMVALIAASWIYASKQAWNGKWRLVRSEPWMVKRRGMNGPADEEGLIARIPRDRRGTALTVTLLHKPQFSQGHGGATAGEKDRQLLPIPGSRN
jgi:hypothetical protein